MRISETSLKGCYIIEPDILKDNRGYFCETFKKKDLEEAIGYSIDFVQENSSVSKKGVLRGLHYQEGEAAQAKLVSVVYGKVLDVVVDIRRNSVTFGRHIKIELSSDNHKSLFIPRGMAHGFLALSDDAKLLYKCDNYYQPKAENGIIYNDDYINIDWFFPSKHLIISKKDKSWPKFNRYLG